MTKEKERLLQELLDTIDKAKKDLDLRPEQEHGMWALFWLGVMVGIASRYEENKEP